MLQGRESVAVVALELEQLVDFELALPVAVKLAGPALAVAVAL